MTGRGIDQAMPHPSSPELYESYVQDARDYIALAERSGGAIERPLGFADIWGDALDELARFDPEVRLINLETSITRNAEPWPGKGIHYRMSPDNAECLKVAGINACCLANNHVLDWQREGLLETLDVLDRLSIPHAGAGGNARRAREPVSLGLPAGGRVRIWSVGLSDSGIPENWQAGDETPGVFMLPSTSHEDTNPLIREITRQRRPGDLAVVSIHWGSNWGYDIPDGHRNLARQLIDAGADVIHGHSSHHPRGMELYRDRPIFYGCGDFINDYEGIGGHGTYRPELGLMIFCRMSRQTGRLEGLWLTPLRRKHLSLYRASDEERRWMRHTLNRERHPDMPAFQLAGENRLELSPGTIPGNR